MENEKTYKTAFKIVIYFTHKADGTPFTDQQIKDCKHRFYIGSFDTRRGKFKHKITDLREAFRKVEAQIRTKYFNRYTTAFIIANDYKGFAVVVRKYVYNIYKAGCGINFIELDKKGNTEIYNIPDADELIKKYYREGLTEDEFKLVKPIDNTVPVALPYYNKPSTYSEKLAHLMA